MAVMDYDRQTYRTDGRTFLERYIPASVESDQHSLRISVTMDGTDAPHRLLSNGRVDGMQVVFPDYTTCSSAYFHLIPESRYFVSATSVTPSGVTIPVKVYSTVAAGGEFHNKAVANVRKSFAEIVDEMGFYPNESFLVHLYPRSGGMEYTGATSCAPSALRHEIFHSWFGRGVRPFDGNSGWIDEAVTSWWVDQRSALDAAAIPKNPSYRRGLQQLATGNSWKRMTPTGSYRQGAAFIRYVATEYHNHGADLKPILLDFAKQNMHEPITTKEFLDYLIEKTP